MAGCTRLAWFCMVMFLNIVTGMYDKVAFWLERVSITDDYTHLTRYLDGATEQTIIGTGETSLYGYRDNLKVSVYNGGVHICGSLAKFLYDGSNIFSLNIKHTTEAIEKIADTFHINIRQAIITELEFGGNFMMAHKVSEYLCKLGELDRMQRVYFNTDTLYYQGTGKKKKPKMLALYDKIAEAKERGMQYPSDLEDKNILRYEIRFKNRVSRQIGVPIIKGATLCEMPFYEKLTGIYQQHYYAIRKNQTNNNMAEIKKPKEALELLFARLMQQPEGQRVKSVFLQELKESGQLDRKNFYRLKKMIDETEAKSDLQGIDELIKELDDDINNVGAYL